MDIDTRFSLSFHPDGSWVQVNSQVDVKGQAPDPPDLVVDLRHSRMRSIHRWVKSNPNAGARVFQSVIMKKRRGSSSLQ